MAWIEDEHGNCVNLSLVQKVYFEIEDFDCESDSGDRYTIMADEECLFSSADRKEAYGFLSLVRGLVGAVDLETALFKDPDPDPDS